VFFASMAKGMRKARSIWRRVAHDVAESSALPSINDGFRVRVRAAASGADAMRLSENDSDTNCACGVPALAKNPVLSR